MKCLKVFILLFLVFFSKLVFAGDPGSNYGCLIWGDRFYTHYLKDDYAPGNVYWGPFHYYDDLGLSYQEDYSNTGCGKINPSTTAAQFSNAGQTCFVKVGPTFQQGALGTYNKARLCELPLDDYSWTLLVAAGGAGFIYLTKFKRAG